MKKAGLIFKQINIIKEALNGNTCVPKWGFSDNWIKDIHSKIKWEIIENSIVNQNIIMSHNTKCEQLITKLKIKSINKWCNIEQSEVEDVVMEAFTNFSTVNNDYDPTKGKTEEQFLLWRINNDLRDLLKRKKNYVELCDYSSSEPSEFNNDTTQDNLTYLKFIANLQKNLPDINPVKLKPSNSKYYYSSKQCEIHPLIKMQAWSSAKKLSTKDINSLALKINADTHSHQHYEWRQPMPIVRIQSWVCFI